MILKKIEKVLEEFEVKNNNTNYIHYAGRIYDKKEILNLIDASLEFWLTSGKYTKKFEKEFSNYLNINYCSLTNSGSSANLLAFMSLTSPLLKERMIKKNDEVITVAAAFPTTVAPIIQYGAIPVFVDIDIPSYNINIEAMKQSLSKRTKAVMLAHTLGNPFNLMEIKAFCAKNNLWLIEDNCDALGSKYFLGDKWYFTGTVGDIGTSSFYPPHHITMGEGGAVYTNNSVLYKIVNSFRDWGRDCWCPPGKDNTCKNRFSKQFGDLPKGYDHKYVYSHFGYNLKVTDLQAAIGCAQLEKLTSFIEKRKINWSAIRKRLKKYEEFLILPEISKNSDPSWFGFLLTVKENSFFNRDDIVKFLEKEKIQTRMLFAGNLIKHPCFNQMRKLKKGYKVIGELRNTDYVMQNSFWIGVYPGISLDDIDYISEKFDFFFRKIIGE